MSENMKAITRINGQSWISYGKIVEQRYLFGIEKPVEKKEDKSHWRTCACCGRLFEPDIRHDGTYSEAKKCGRCYDERNKIEEGAAE